jgi:3-oxoacyl-[acyl-carrier protein] reductase
LIEEGVEVAISARDEARLRATAYAIGAKAAIPVDLGVAGAGTALVAEARARLGGVDILVTNTGGPPQGSFLSVSERDWAAALQGLWMSAINSIRAALPAMVEQGWGRILLITSLSAKEPIAGLMISNALRPGLVGLTNALSKEVARAGVTVNALMPGYIDTERLAELGIDRDRIAATIPAGRLGTPAELASLATFLASEAAAYVTGQAIACDGGRLGTI